jgi:hypothetical protein
MFILVSIKTSYFSKKKINLENDFVYLPLQQRKNYEEGSKIENEDKSKEEWQEGHDYKIKNGVGFK